MKNTLKNIFLMLAVVSMAIFFSSCSEDSTDPTDEDGDGSGSSTTTTIADGGTLGSSDSEYTVYSKDVTIEADANVTLDGRVYIDSNATLTIGAGVTIKSKVTDANLDVIIIKRFGKIIANGTAAKPITITSGGAAGARSAQDWGGLQILGNAPSKGGGVGTAEGLGSTHGLAGGTVNDDNSGKLNYVIIQFAGKIYSDDEELNGLALFGVGSGTEIDYVQTHRCSDDGYEPYGGSVDLNHIVGSANLDDQFDCAGPWLGDVNYGLSICCYDGGSAIEYDGDEGESGTDTSQVAFNNVVVSCAGLTSKYATLWREDGIFTVSNNTWYISNCAYAVKMEDDDTDTSGNAASLTIKDSTLHIADCTTDYDIPAACTFNTNDNVTIDSDFSDGEVVWEDAADLAAATISGQKVGDLDAGFDISWCEFPEN